MINVFPVLSRSYHLADQKSQLIQDKSIKYLLAISLPLAAGMIAAAEPIVNLLYGPGFEASVVPLRLMALNVPLISLYSVLWRILAARGQQGLELRAQIFTTFTRLGSGYVLIAALASVGAAITTPVNYVLHNLLLSLYIKRDGTRLHLIRLCWRFALAALGMGLLTWPLSHQLPLWILVLLAGALYMVLVLLLKAFSPDDFALFHNIWQARLGRRRHYERNV